MSPERPGSASRRFGRVLLALLALGAAAVASIRLARDASQRREAEALLPPTPAGEESEAVDTETLSLEPAWDLAADAVVTEALASPAGKVSPEVRRRARNLMLRALTERPGWSTHRYLLALSDESPSGERARSALRLAAGGAPGLDTAWKALGRANLASWKDLPAPARTQAEKDLGRAARSADFVGAEFAEMVAVLGRPRAAALLPDDSQALETAAGSLAQTGDVNGAADLLARSEQAERRERAEEMEALEHRRALGDVDGLRLGCMAWFDRHALAGLGDAEGQRQLARLLALFPDDRFGSWARDRRARIVKFLLDGRMASVPPEIVRRTLAALNGVPDPARARLELAAGDAAAARALADETGEPLPPEWGPYAIEVAKREIAAGRLNEASRAIESLGAAGREGCEALLVRREIARRRGDSAESQSVESRLAALRLPAAEDWSSRGALTLCVDPEWSGGQVLDVEIGPGSPALVSWGWNGARMGTLAVPPEEGSVRAPLHGMEGQKTLWISFLVGGEGRTLHGLLRRAS